MYSSPGRRQGGRKTGIAAGLFSAGGAFGAGRAGKGGDVDGVTRIFTRSLRGAASNGAVANGLLTSGGGAGATRSISIAGTARAAAVSPYTRVGRERSRKEAVDGQWGHDMFDPYEGDHVVRTRVNLNRGAAWAGKAASSGQDDLSKRRLSVENLHYEVLEEDLRELFGSFGTVVKLILHYDASGRSEGRADVTFADAACAKSALNALNNRLLDGQPMQIKYYEPPPRWESGLYSSGRLEKRGGIFARLGGINMPKFGGRGEGAGRRGFKCNGRSALSVEDLDADMDAYMKG